MCKHHHKQNMDKCMKNIIGFINRHTSYKTLMSCCGHGKYPPSIIVINTQVGEWCSIPYELFSGCYFEYGKKRFYKKDKEGYYYIPECLKVS